MIFMRALQQLLWQFTAEQVWLIYYTFSTLLIWFVDNETALKAIACAGWLVALACLRTCYYCGGRTQKFLRKNSV